MALRIGPFAASAPGAELLAQAGLETDAVFVTYGMEEGLSQGSVQALLQDREGFLWLGTQDGLNRFDGITFRIYRHLPEDSLSLSDDFVWALAEAEGSKLWVGSDRGGLDLLDPGTGRAVHYPLSELGTWEEESRPTGPGPPPETEGTSRAGRTVWEIVPLSDGSLLLSTDRGLAHFHPATGNADLVPDSGVEGRRGLACSTPSGDALVAFDDGSIARFSAGVSGLTKVGEIPSAVAVLRCPTATEPVVVAGADGAVYSLGPPDGRAERLLRIDPAGGTRVIRSLLPDAGGKLWIGTSDGLFVGNVHTAETRRVDGSGPRAIPHPVITGFLVDRSGVLWIGTWNGVASLHPLALTIQRVLSEAPEGRGLGGAGVVAIESAGQDRWWVGTDTKGVFEVRRDESDGRLKTARPESLASLADAWVFGIATGPKGEFWLATLREGVYRFNPGTGRIVAVPVLDAEDGGRVLLYSLLVDSRGEIWAGSRGLGLLRFDASRGGFVSFLGPQDDWDFGSRWIWPIVEARDGTLWIGAYNGGLSSIDRERKAHTLHSREAASLSDDRILSVFADSRGLVWIGTEGGGLRRYDPQSNESRLFSSGSGLPHDNVQSILEDDGGELWITTSDGVARLDPISERIETFSEAVGLAGNRFYAGAALKDERGQLILGGAAGLTILDPRRFPRDPGQIPVAFKGFSILGREASLSRTRSTSGLTLEPGENFFAFEFAALDFRDPSQHRYRYRLDPLDDDWVNAGSVGFANYTSVPPRGYTFRVSARGSDGIWNDDAISLPVFVQPHYYETWWFQALVALAALGLISGIYAYRVYELHARQRLRLGIAGDLHDKLAPDLSTIAMRVELISRADKLDEEGRTQLGDMASLARKTTSHIREKLWVVSSKHDNVVGLVDKLRDTADAMLAGQVDYQFAAPSELPDREIGWQLRQDIYLILQESLQNISKHSGASHVDIEIGYEDPYLSLRIRDDGRGFDPAQIVEGHGTGSMKQRARRHRAELVRDSRPGEGCTVKLKVKMK